jgi:hypothetical protein
MTGPSQPRPLAPGDVLDLSEQDYLYGAGRLVLDVTAVGADITRYPRLEWLRVTGDEIRWNGADAGERTIMVRVEALRRAVRPRGWRPTR